MSLIVNDVLESVSRALVEKTLNSVLPGNVPAGPQLVPIVDPSIYIGALLIVGSGQTREIVAVTAITAIGFTATFANNHNAGEVIKAATFPSGQINQYVVAAVQPGAAVSPLFTQAEMLQYARDAQNDLLAGARMIYAIVQQNLKQGVAAYASPIDSIRIERISVGGVALWNTTQSDLDLENESWQGGQRIPPRQWYQDKLGPANFAVQPTPAINLIGADGAQLWYSQKGTALPLLTDSLIVPDIFWPGLKYGILQKSWEKEGEARDPRRAAYCQKRFTRYILYGVRLMQAVELALKNNV